VEPLDSATATFTARVAVPLRGASELRAHSRSTRSASIVPSASGVIRPAAMALRTAASDTPVACVGTNRNTHIPLRGTFNHLFVIPAD
jgi:hypothetical protein